MPRKRLLRTNEFPYHVVSRSRNKDWYQVPMQKLWQNVKECLKEVNEIHTFELHAFVLMGNHYHMLITTPFCNIDEVMYEFNRRFSLKVRCNSQRINQIFGGRYRWCLVDSEKYLFNVYRYLYQNPLRGGLQITCENYPFSTLGYEIRKKKFAVSIQNHFDFNQPELIEALNRPYTKQQNDMIRKGFRGSSFVPAKVGNARKRISLD